MSNIARSIRLEVDQQRIRSWRLERQKIAEIEKQQRIKEKEKLKAQQERDLPEIQAPSPDDEADFNRAISARKTKAKVSFIAQVTITLFLPLCLTVWYLFFLATPLYESKSIVAFESSASNQRNTSQSTLFAPNQTHSLQLAFAADSYANSAAMIETLNVETGAIDHFSGTSIDPLQRVQALPFFGLPRESSFKRFLKTDVDIQTGFLTISVRADSPDLGKMISQVVLDVLRDRLTAEELMHREMQLAALEHDVEIAESNFRNAQTAVSNLQLLHGLVEPDKEVEAIRLKVANIEKQVQSLDLDIARLRVAGQTEGFRTQQALDLRNQLLEDAETLRTSIVDGAPSLIELTQIFRQAQLEGALAEQQLENAYDARTSIARLASQHQNTMSIVVPTQTTNVPVYPNKPGALIFAFVLLLGFFAFLRTTVFKPNMSKI